MDTKFELILCIVNQGFSEEVMSAARECGARGGTVLNARGTAKEEAEAMFNISITPEKELVMILATADIKDEILHAIYKHVGLGTAGQGIAFTVPVNDVVGIGSKKPVEEE
ncbi:MAG: P-II family nitrogen regulator [Acholeplasmatales bacterium]|nr:P-II family nitrogen regulator [Acholeplasmatales bacterium]